MNATTTLKIIPRWQEIAGRALMALAALGALGAFLSAIGAVRGATAATVWLETWRMFGFLVFTGMFALLALRPRASAGIWELAFFHKAAMAVSALLLPGAAGAASAMAIDGALAIMVLLAYLLTRGWTAWKTQR
ncbi:hypothetical protein FDZ74_02565 [bacterium]|nr:MAG: hypothetical protein FDZ74_02565 [bacterium]